MLFLGYATGLQIWDCTDLARVSEVLNLSSDADWGCVSFAGILPAPAPGQQTIADAFDKERPLIGVVCVPPFCLIDF